MDIVIDMDIEEAAVAALVKAITQPVLYGVERWNTGDLSHPLEEIRSGKALMEQGEIRMESREIIVFGLPFIDARVMSSHLFQRRKAAAERIREGRIEEIVDNDMSERGCLVELFFEAKDGGCVEMSKVEDGAICHGQVL